jgi:hypothetical protein
MIVRELYERYQVPPWLQLHQLRVAAVGEVLAKGIQGADSALVLSTCLLHDIGAIVKFDFTYTTHSALRSLCPSEEIPHWEAVQEKIRARYGIEEHDATEGILNELGKDVERRIFDQMGLRNMAQILASEDRNLQIAQYADMRVGPFGILSIQERLADGAARYAASWKEDGTAHIADSFPANVQKLEDLLFARIALRPEDITDASIAARIEELWEYAIA